MTQRSMRGMPRSGCWGDRRDGSRRCWPCATLVTPFGLKTSLPSEIAPANAIGLFPILSETPDRLVAGFNDKHLDFRVVVDVTASGQGRRVTATTLVLTHNLLGRAYLAMILPFHRLVVRAMLQQVAG